MAIKIGVGHILAQFAPGPFPLTIWSLTNPQTVNDESDIDHQKI